MGLIFFLSDTNCFDTPSKELVRFSRSSVNMSLVLILPLGHVVAMLTSWMSNPEIL